MANEFFSAVKNRRTIYGISKESVITDEKIKEIVSDAVTYSPSAFNSQSARVVVLLGGQHDKLWDITMEVLRKIVPADRFGPTQDKINSFKSGYGSVLFFEDQDVVKGLQAKFPPYKDNFPLWSLQSAGMLQLVVWTALEAEGLGASLQHYNPIIDADVKKQWDIPESWSLLAQMPFGKPTAGPGDKEFEPLEKRLRIYK